MKIEVTKVDIKNGKRNKFNTCPVALAFRRKTKRKRVIVKSNAIYDGNGRHTLCFLPKKAGRFIERFDNGKSVRPISFYVVL